MLLTGVFCVCLITSLVLFGVSFDTVEPWQYGVKFDASTQHIRTDKVCYCD
jgi:hypothetical protein